MAFSVPLFGVKMPLPPLQVPPVATVTLPFSCTSGSLAHTVRSAPTLAVGAGVKATYRESRTASHRPLPVLVRKSQRPPAFSSEALGV